MSTRQRTRTPAGGVTPPLPPPAAATTGEGPMRRELLRQIARLEIELSASTPGWEPTCTTPSRGPAIAGTAELEARRDELLRAARRARPE